PVSVRKTAKFHGLNTDASFRYERGADPNITVYALKRAILLMQEVAGGKVSSEIIDVYPKPIQDFNVELAYSTCDKLIGEKLDRAIIKKILLSLDIKIVNETAESLMLQIPPFKADVQRDVDVVEEILRVFGYNNIKLPDLMSSALVYRPSVDKDKIINTLSDLLVSQGFNEILSNSLTKSSYYQEKDSLVKLLNPLSSELDVMRQTLLFNGLETIVYNQNRKSPNIKFFEIGKTYTKQSDKFVENSFVGIFISGNYAQENWSVNKSATNFFHLKGYVQTILEKFGLAEANFLFNQESDSLFNYALTYQLNDKELVKLGKVSTKIQKQFDITNEVFYAQINLDNFMKLASKTKIQYKEIGKYPSVRRDLALLIDKQIN
ncbi:MAG TPA: phenylalanine--tRNA ligase beta subunit-related protein, partial [Vicingus sp.]|nr:phenylalanine--tRNA ligase beta subunit-related protein [Vicingus sp.]